MRGSLMIVATALGTVLLGCGGGQDDATGGNGTASGSPSMTEVASTQTAAAPDPTAEVVIESFSFGEPTTVQADTAFTVTNADAAEHTLTADDDSFDAGNLLPGESTVVEVGAARTVTFHCEIHPDM